MDSKIIDALLNEVAELEQKLSAVRYTLGIYGALPANNSRTVPDQAKQAPSSSDSTITAPDAIQRRASAYADSIRDVARLTIECADVLPVPTRDIIDEVKNAGIAIRGQSELNAVSALLSRHDDFVSNGRAGWTLAKLEKVSGPEGSNGNGEAMAEPDERDGEVRTSPAPEFLTSSQS